MIILGIQLDSHDTGVALLKDGNILAAVNEERYSRIKQDGNAPVKSLKACLGITGTEPEDIDIIVFPTYASTIKKLGCSVKQITGIWTFTRGKYIWIEKERKIHKFIRHLGHPLPQSYKLYKRLKSSTRKIFEILNGFDGEIKFVDHNLSHAASAYYTSGWVDGTVIVLEGSGWDVTTGVYSGSQGDIERIATTMWPHSLGQYYRTVTEILGFTPGRHEGKITGLASYGNPKKAYSKVSPLISCDDLKLKCDPTVYTLKAEYRVNKMIPNYFKNFSREDIAAAFQKRLEEVACKLVKNSIAKTGLRKVALAGGVTANVKMNQRIRDLDEVEDIFIHPGMGDMGLALGSALYVWYNDSNSNYTPQKLNDVYFGPEFSNDVIEEELTNYNLKYEYVKNVEKYIGVLLAEGKTVGRFAGRMEYGPRTLGDRSILYQPIDPSVNDWLNKKLDRTEFMPFAPTTLLDRADECYADYDLSSYSAKFMTITYDVTKDMKTSQPAVVHVDNTARPQYLMKNNNPSYFKILKYYESETNLPSIINTSFNMHEEPIVCTPRDGIKAFIEAELDVLAMENFIVERHNKT